MTQRRLWTMLAMSLALGATFLNLCGERKTLERIRHTLKPGKPLRN